ncbi:MAG: hypothetical protein JWP03_4128 [Phycisphaerales bacterium]|jgi:hypothetical protein|nr:hypothetical protein [Phycisphaerales bacterium]
MTHIPQPVVPARVWTVGSVGFGRAWREKKGMIPLVIPGAIAHKLEGQNRGNDGQWASDRRVAPCYASTPWDRITT